MSSIPSNIVSSVAGAPMQSREAARERESASAGQADAASRQTKAITDAGDVVETTDSDAQVFADSEGTGSQGRHSEGEQTPAQDEPVARRGITRGDDGQIHLDLEA